MKIETNKAPGHTALAGMPTSPDVTELMLRAEQLYAQAPYWMRKMMYCRIQICPFERLVPLVSPGSSVLDIGCGAGLFLALLAGSTQDVSGVGFDSSSPAIDAAVRMTEQVMLSNSRANLRFMRLDVAELWPEGRFDVVSLVDVLHHVPPAHQKALITRAAEKVNPGGVMLYKDMADRPAFHAWMNRFHDLLFARQWIHYVPVRTVEKWAEEAGLSLAHPEAISRLWYRHELRVFRKPANT